MNAEKKNEKLCKKNASYGEQNEDAAKSYVNTNRNSNDRNEENTKSNSETVYATEENSTFFTLTDRCYSTFSQQKTKIKLKTKKIYISFYGKPLKSN